MQNQTKSCSELKFITNDSKPIHNDVNYYKKHSNKRKKHCNYCDITTIKYKTITDIVIIAALVSMMRAAR